MAAQITPPEDAAQIHPPEEPAGLVFYKNLPKGNVKRDIDLSDQTECCSNEEKLAPKHRASESQCDQGHPMAWRTLWEKSGISPHLSQNFTSPEAGLHLCSHSNNAPSSPGPQIQDQADLGLRQEMALPTAHVTHLPGTTVWITPVCCQRFAKQSLKYQCDT